MRIGILSFRKPPNRFYAEEKRLQEEGEKKGHEVRLLRASLCSLEFDGKEKLGIRYGQKAFPKLDVIIPRVHLLTNFLTRMAVLKQCELMGIPLINSSNAILRAKSKIHTLQILSHFGIPVVKTMVLQDAQYLEQGLKYIGSFPMIIKATFGSLGNNVTLVETKRAATSTFGMLSKSLTDSNMLLLQEYIESGGKDIRLFVIGGKVAGAMERTAADGDFRSNVGQGGTGKMYEPQRREVHLAIRASKALGLDIAGVDIIHTKHGPAIMEVNANPGFQELEKATGLNIAELIIKYARKFVSEYVPREEW